MILLLLCPTYFTRYDSLQVHPCGCKWPYFILLMAGQYSTVYRYYIFITHSCWWTLRWLPCLGYCKQCCMNTGVVHTSLWMMFFSGYMPRSELQGLIVVLVLIFFRNLHTVLPSGCTNLHSRQQCRRVPFPLRVFLMIEMRMHVISKHHNILWFPFSEAVISS